MRFGQPERPADLDLLSGQVVTARLIPEELGDPQLDPASYGKRLSEQLFHSNRAALAFGKAMGLAAGAGQGLRLRLSIVPAAGELHRLAWETLVDPDDGGLLSTRENLLFSRFQRITGERGLRPGGHAPLRPLICAAAPRNLADYHLPEIDAAGEIAQVEAAMAGSVAYALHPDARLGGPYGPASLERILTALRAGPPCDIFYLVSHGGYVNGQFWLVLEDERRQLARVSGDEFAQLLAGLETLPRLVVLVACHGGSYAGGIAAFDGQETRAAFGARLVETGVPAVIAMQAQFGVETAKIFMPAFFGELARDGVIDRAVAVARRGARACGDYWVPSLMMGLNNGRLWQDPAKGPTSKYTIHIHSAQNVIQGDHPVVNINQ